MKSRVSIPLITYNHENFLHQALDGILMQEVNFPYEIIIAEDCSTDGTREIAAEYANRYPEKIKLITSESNVGIIENSVRAVEACQGKYFAFCEGDDYWNDPQKLQKQVDYLEKNKDCGMIHTDVHYYFQELGKLVKDYHRTNSIKFPSGNVFLEILAGSYFIKTATVMVRRELFLKAFNHELFNQKEWKLTDQAIWLDIAANSNIWYLDETTATYRLVEESLSRTKDIYKKHLFHKSLYDIKFYFWEKYSRDEEIKAKLDKDYHLMLLGDAFKMNNRKLAKQAFDFFKNSGTSFPIKQKVKYWALQNRFIGLLLERVIKIIRKF